MKSIVLNLCGIKSKGGINTAKNFIKNNDHLRLFIIFDNEEFYEIIEKSEKKFINIPRYFHPFLSLFIGKETRKKISEYDLIIHFGNFGFKSKIKSLTFIQNILPLVTPFSSFRNLFLRILYTFSFSISDEIIVQQKHVAELINSSKTKIIGNIIYKKIKQNNVGGFVVIIEDNRNKNPNFLLRVVDKLIELNYEVTVINISKFTISNKAKIVISPSHKELLEIFNKNQTYIHASDYETVGLPIYEALNSGLKVVVPKKDYISIENPNIYKYKIGDVESIIQACLDSANKKNEFEEVPIYFEDWKLT